MSIFITRLFGATAAFMLSVNVHASVPEEAEAKLEPKNNSKVSGEIEFEPTADGMKVSYELQGLTPSQKHGFHIHEKGDCSSPDAKSAGPHFSKVKSGDGTSKDTPDEYAGDFPEVQANASGKAEGEFLMPRLSFEGDFSILNRAVIVHAKPDNPTKASAPRIGCGVIKPSVES